jgi:hypothetical protein
MWVAGQLRCYFEKAVCLLCIEEEWPSRTRDPLDDSSDKAPISRLRRPQLTRSRRIA